MATQSYELVHKLTGDGTTGPADCPGRSWVLLCSGLRLAVAADLGAFGRVLGLS
jgi:hypothetical protein